MKDLATITNFIARQVGGAGAGVAVAALVAKTVLAAAQKGGINYAKLQYLIHMAIIMMEY